MKSKISKIGILFFACLTLFFLVGCGQSEAEDDDNGLVNGDENGDNGLINDQDDDINDDVDDDINDEDIDDSELLPDNGELVKDDSYWNYINLMVETMCMMFGDEDLFLMEEEEWNVIAQEYGFESYGEAEIYGMQYEDNLEFIEDYLESLQESCPDAFEFFEAFGEEYS